MRQVLFPMIAMLLLPSCNLLSPVSPNEQGLCIGLRPYVNELATSLLEDGVPTHAIVAGARVVKGFNSGCQIAS